MVIGTNGHRNIWFTPTSNIGLHCQHNNFMLKFIIESPNNLAACLQGLKYFFQNLYTISSHNLTAGHMYKEQAQVCNKLRQSMFIILQINCLCIELNNHQHTVLITTPTSLLGKVRLGCNNKSKYCYFCDI